MLYPSTFGAGLPGFPEYKNAIAFPYEVVYLSTIRAVERLKKVNPKAVVRDWIQDFPDYRFDKRTYTPEEIREQMRGATEGGGAGWMLWDPRVKYTAAALVTDSTRYPANEQGDIMVLRYENFGHKDEGLQRSSASFRQDLERLWAAGYYPVNLRDLATLFLPE